MPTFGRLLLTGATRSGSRLEISNALPSPARSWLKNSRILERFVFAFGHRAVTAFSEKKGGPDSARLLDRFALSQTLSYLVHDLLHYCGSTRLEVRVAAVD